MSMGGTIGLTRVDAKRRTMIPLDLSEGIAPGDILLWVRRGNTLQFIRASGPSDRLADLSPEADQVTAEQIAAARQGWKEEATLLFEEMEQAFVRANGEDRYGDA